MSKRSDEEDPGENLRDRIIGLGERSLRKSYYPQLQERIAELERFRALLDQSRDAILLLQAPLGRVVDATESACTQMGRSREKLLLMTVEELWPGAVAESVIRLLQGEPTVSALDTIEAEMVSRSGDHFPVEVTLRLVHFHDADYVVAVARDITRRKQAEEKYRSIFENAVEGIFQVTASGRVISANPALARIFGYDSPQEFMEKVGSIEGRLCVSPERREQLLRLAGERGTVTGFEVQMRRKDGAAIWASINARSVCDEKREVLLIEGFLEDITQRKLLEEQIRRASRMEAVGRLAGGVAHDFNNLLTAVLGYSDLLLKQTRDQGRREKLTQIRRAAELAASLTKQLLAFSRKQVLDVRLLDLNALVADFRTMLERLIGEDIEISTVLEHSLGKVRADPSQIQQVLMNLAVNARDAMPNGGTLTLETTNTVLDDEYARTHPEVIPGPCAMLAVSDTGIGMDAETRSRIFEPFFTTKAKGVGTGLGLSTVYGVVKQHQGHVVVYSEPGRGTTFKIYFPLVRGHAEQPGADLKTATGDIGARTILVVEDEQIVADLVCEALETEGCSLLKARNPEEALRISDDFSGEIDLLLTDVVLPQMDGRSLFLHLSELRPRMKVLYVSGYTEDFIVRHGVLHRGVHFLQKPFTLESLSRKVSEVLSD
jgi:two-component system, cell cycle sensor histidine kinase and response regulator CckA